MVWNLIYKAEQLTQHTHWIARLEGRHQQRASECLGGRNRKASEYYPHPATTNTRIVRGFAILLLF